jgi:hypothetical protein
MAQQQPIKLNPNHKGDFTAKAKAAGKSIPAFANSVLKPGSGASGLTKEQANFDRNFGKSKK